MGKLTAKRRQSLPKSDFALGSGYPIPDRAHARSPLARAAANATPAQQAKVKAAVRKKFPDMEVGGVKPKAKAKGRKKSR